MNASKARSGSTLRVRRAVAARATARATTSAAFPGRRFDTPWIAFEPGPPTRVRR